MEKPNTLEQNHVHSIEGLTKRVDALEALLKEKKLSKEDSVIDPRHLIRSVETYPSVRKRFLGLGDRLGTNLEKLIQSRGRNSPGWRERVLNPLVEKGRDIMAPVVEYWKAERSKKGIRSATLEDISTPTDEAILEEREGMKKFGEHLPKNADQETYVRWLSGEDTEEKKTDPYENFEDEEYPQYLYAALDKREKLGQIVELGEKKRGKARERKENIRSAGAAVKGVFQNAA